MSELRAYEAPNACRVASILWQIMQEEDLSRVNKSVIVGRWAFRYPRHAVHTGPGSVAIRVKSGLRYLEEAGIVRVANGDIEVVQSEWLGMSAANLGIVEESGVALGRSLWTVLPAVPEHLRDKQEPLAPRESTTEAESVE